jgi:hypothetical protein
MKTVPLSDIAAPCPAKNPADEATPHPQQLLPTRSTANQSGGVVGRHPGEELQWKRQRWGQLERLDDGQHSEGGPIEAMADAREGDRGSGSAHPTASPTVSPWHGPMNNRPGSTTRGPPPLGSPPSMRLFPAPAVGFLWYHHPLRSALPTTS